MYPWKTTIPIDRTMQTPIFIQIVNAVINEVKQGRITPGQKLPGTRSLGKLLGLNRKTVEIAYDELMAQGWIEINPSKGTFVSEALPIVTYQKLITDDSLKPNIATEVGFNLKPDLTLKDVYSIPKFKLEIDDGSPDSRIAPLDLLIRKSRRIAQNHNFRQLLNYTDVQGEISLREVLSDYLHQTRGLICGPENIFISRGSQMGLYLIFNILLIKNDKVIVGDTSYVSADKTILYAGGQLIKVKVDDEGINVDEIENICKTTKIRGIFITPHHHFPTTVTLSAHRRIRLLSLAEKYRFAIVEDDYDYDFHYTSSPLLPLASLDSQGMVIYVGSFSKLLAPSVRIGYIVAPENLVHEINKLRRIVDRQGDHILEKVIAEMIAEGEIQRHLKKAVKIYKDRRDQFCQLLSQSLDDKVSFNIPNGGMAVWTKFELPIEKDILTKQLLKEGVLLNVNFDYVNQFNALRLGFASLNNQELKQAIDALALVL